MIDSYIDLKKEKESKSKLRDNFFFGVCFGMILVLISFYKLFFVIDVMKYDKLYISLIIIGSIIIFISIIYPNLLSFLKFFLSKIINFIGMVIFSIVLTIIYFLLVCPFGILIRKRDKNYLTSQSSTLIDYKYNNSIININKHSFLYQISKLFRFFFAEKYVILIPILIILIIIAILLVFVQSSAIAPFIYTIF